MNLETQELAYKNSRPKEKKKKKDSPEKNPPCEEL